MPHKVNPIDFENAEGNLELANGLLMMLANKLAGSRLQRDLSDSTVKRNLGTAIGYSLLGVKSLIKGLNKVGPNETKLKQELEAHPEMLAEAGQLWLKTKGKARAYEELKLKTRGRKVSLREMKDWLPEELKKLKVKNYTGWAEKLTNREIKRINKLIKEARGGG
jgi:adenylosuccinate lyase